MYQMSFNYLSPNYSGKIKGNWEQLKRGIYKSFFKRAQVQFSKSPFWANVML